MLSCTRRTTTSIPFHPLATSNLGVQPVFYILNDQIYSYSECAPSLSVFICPLAIQQARHRVSCYADDAVIFLKPHNSDLVTIQQLLELFGHVSGLRTNLAKSLVSPIHCVLKMALTCKHPLLFCKVFPCMYLGLHSLWGNQLRT